MDPLLRFGPYSPPACSVGGELTCEIYGLSIVADWTEAPISWPRRKPDRHKGRRTLIICGDLYTALAIESAPAIAHYWGVSEAAIVRWRRALGMVGEYPEGAREELRDHLAERRDLHPEMLTQGTGAKSNPRPDAWLPEEDEIVLAHAPQAAAAMLNRTLNAVYLRSERLRRK